MLKTDASPRFFLQAELETLQSLVELLKTERDELIAAEVDRLPAITREKSGLVAHLNQLSKERQNTMLLAGFTPDQQGMRAWVESDEAAECKTIWSTLLDLTRTAKELNRVNGLMINKHLTTGNQKLNILSSASATSGLYGPDGQSKMSSGMRRLVVG